MNWRDISINIFKNFEIKTRQDTFDSLHITLESGAYFKIHSSMTFTLNSNDDVNSETIKNKLIQYGFCHLV